jgi:hypothetical protein
MCIWDALGQNEILVMVAEEGLEPWTSNISISGAIESSKNEKAPNEAPLNFGLQLHSNPVPNCIHQRIAHPQIRINVTA